MQLQRPRNIQLHTPQHFDRCGHGTSFASLSKGCQTLAELNRYHRRLARHELLGERPLRSNPDPDPDPGPGPGERSKGGPATEIQVTPVGVIKCVETPLLPPARHSPKRLPLESAKVHHEGSAIALPTWTVERLVIPRARPLPRRWGKGKEIQASIHPRGSAIASPMSVPTVRPLPHQWGKRRDPNLEQTWKEEDARMPGEDDAATERGPVGLSQSGMRSHG
jgi:hypothetical protein